MKLKIWLNVVTFIAVGAVIIFAWHDIMAALAAMRDLNLWVLSLMIPAQFFVFYAISMVYKHFFQVTGQTVPLKTLLPAAIELNFVNHVFPSGGVSGFSYLAMRLKHDKVPVGRTTLAQLVRYAFTFLTFIVLMIVALILLAAEDHAGRMVIFIATAITFSILFTSLGAIYVIGSAARIRGFTRGTTVFLNKLIRIVKRHHPEPISLSKVESTFYDLHKDFLIIKKDIGKMRPIIWWALVANIAEIGLIYIAFVAHGAWVNPGAVIIAYALATLVGLLAILPGGLGIYEPLMAATLLTAGVSGAVAVSATLVSRVVTLVLALGSGYVLYHLTLRRHARHNT